MVSTLHKDHPEKATAIIALFDFTLPLAKPIIQLHIKQKENNQQDLLKSTSSEAIKKNLSECGFFKPEAGR